jgi:hypothetical protein
LLTVAGGGSATSDRVLDLLQKVSGIERSVVYLEASSQDTKQKVESIGKDVLELKTRLNTLEPIAVWIARGIWTLVCGVAAFLLTVLGMWL